MSSLLSLLVAAAVVTSLISLQNSYRVVVHCVDDTLQDSTNWRLFFEARLNLAPPVTVFVPSAQKSFWLPKCGGNCGRAETGSLGTL